MTLILRQLFDSRQNETPLDLLLPPELELHHMFPRVFLTAEMRSVVDVW